MSLNKRAGRRGVAALVAAVAVASLLTGTVAVAGPAWASSTEGCVGARDKVADITRHIVKSNDYGADGHIWALDTFDERVRLWQVGLNQYCIRREFAGTFESFAGVSPGGTGTISAGVTGTWHGTIVAYLTGDFVPVAPTSGDQGTYVENCDQLGNCETYDPTVREMWFPDGLRHVRYTSFAATFDGGSHGIWMQDIDSSTGDITG